MLTYLAPGGSGKSLLLKHLRVKECSLPDGRAALPYAYLDFTLPHTPKDLLSILIALRDQLQQHDDRQGNHLTFPRFDLGALMARGALNGEDPESLTPNQVRSKLTEGKHFFESLTALSSTLGYAVPFVPALMAGLNVAGQIKAVNDILSFLEDSTGWKWYRQHGSETGLGANARLKDVMHRLYSWSMPGKPERDDVISHLLPEAFLADLLDALVQSNPTHAWSSDANVVLFFDGFEELLSDPGKDTTAIQLLEALTLSS
jgi:hypothetical protein